MVFANSAEEVVTCGVTVALRVMGIESLAVMVG